MPVRMPRRVQYAIALIGGFFSAFVAMIAVTVMQTATLYKGQLVAGSQELNRQMPSTLNVILDASGGLNPIMNSMMSYFWWVAVIMFGLLFSWVLFTWMRRVW